MPEIKHIISDLDGTLVDTFEANLVTYQEILAEYGFKLTREAYRAAFGKRLDGLLAALDAERLLPYITEIKARKAERYPTHFNLLRLNEPLVYFYRMFTSNGGHLALSSTASAANVANVLKSVGCEKLFNPIVTSECVKHGKPAPDCYLAVAEQWNVSPERILVFEDSEVGVQAALNAGMQVLRIGKF